MKAARVDSHFIELIFIILIALVLLWPNPYQASNLSIVPDSVEYAVGANRYYQFGHYDLDVCGKIYPPRYLPWFSLFFVLPSYYLFGPELGNGVFIVGFLGMLSVLIAFYLGKEIQGLRAGIFSALLLLAIPGYTKLSKEIMTDVPSIFFVLLSLLLYFRCKQKSAALAFSAGLSVALIGALRPLCLCIGIPFFVMFVKERRFRELILFALLPLIQIGATLYYNHVTFGAWDRSGYHYWTAIPYDYIDLVISYKYLQQNLFALVWLIFLLGIGLLAGIPRSEPKKLLLTFFFFGALPITIFHLFYFYPEIRFHYPSIALATIFAGCGCAHIFDKSGVSRSFVRLSLVVLLGAVFANEQIFPVLPNRRLAADHLANALTKDAILVSGLDPVYLEALVTRGTDRKMVPISRRVEYASKFITPRRLPFPGSYPITEVDHTGAGLVKRGTFPAIDTVAEENPEYLRSEIRKGQKVFADLSFLDSEEKNFLAAQFHLKPVDSIISELLIENEPGSLNETTDLPTRP